MVGFQKFGHICIASSGVGEGARGLLAPPKFVEWGPGPPIAVTHV